MKTILLTTLALSLWIIGTAAPTGDPTPAEIIKKSEEKFRGTSNESVITLKIVRPKWTREMTIKTWTLGDNYMMMKVQAPARDQGVGYLKRDKEIWNYQPNIDRTVKLPPSMMMQSWMGSDLTNDDLVQQSSEVRDYNHKLLGKETIEGRECYKIELLPKPDAPVVWGKLLLWIDTKDFLQLKAEFYDEELALANTMYGKAIKKMDDRIIPTVLEIVPADKPGQKTVMTYNSIKFNVPLKESFFSLQNIKNAR